MTFVKRCRPTWSIVIVQLQVGGIYISRRNEELLTVQEVAQRLRVSDATVRHWIKIGVLEAIVLPHPGKREVYRIRRAALEVARKLLDY